MKYLFNLCNIICLTAAIFFMVDLLYKYADRALSELPYNVSTADRTNTGNAVGFTTDMTASSSSQENQYSGASVKARSIDHYNIIYKRDIFRTTEAAENRQNIEDDDSISEKELALLEKTELKLTLWGTVTGGDDSENYAVIESNKDKRQELYRKGDKIEDAVIKKILRFSVILSRDGKDERLEITDQTLSNRGRIGVADSSKSPGNLTASASTEEDDKIVMSIKKSMIDESMQDINALMNQVRIRPHFTGGNADGILLYGIKQTSMFKNMGIQNGDIIIGVDGKAINSVDDAISLYDRLKNSSEMKMQIRRRGQIKEMIYNVEQ